MEDRSDESNISEHIKHIFEEEELDERPVVRKFRTTASDGKNYNKIRYNLDMIISFGYRVKSKIATNFCRWATERLKEYIYTGGSHYERYNMFSQPRRNKRLFEQLVSV